MNTNYLIKKKNVCLFYKELLNKRSFIFKKGVAFSFKIYFSLYFCSDFNLKATVVKTDKIRGLKQLFTPSIHLTGKNCFLKILNNY